MATESEAARLALSVERWIAEARSGCRPALERLFETFYPFLLAAAQHELGAALRSRIDPEDVVQDTVLKAWQRFADFHGQSEAEWRAWLRQTLRCTLANEYRRHVQTARRSVRREVSMDQVTVIPQREDAEHEAGSPDEPVLVQEEYEMLEHVLRQLPPRYREVLWLHTQQELSFAQVGERLHCSAEAARKLWQRAVGKLACLLHSAWES